MARLLAGFSRTHDLENRFLNPMEPLNLSSPEQTLVSFFEAMNKWERDCWSRLRENRDYQTRLKENMDEMNGIFRSLCTPKSRPLGRAGTFQHPPEYDPKIEEIVKTESNRHKAIIYTHQSSGLGQNARYVLVLRDGKWLIDSKQIILADGSMLKSAL